MKKIFYTKNAEETKVLAAKLVKTWKGGDVVGLVGDLGAGKTTFVQGVAKALGIKRAVRSPTFLRLQVYKIPKKLPVMPPSDGTPPTAVASYQLRVTYFVHIDAYRIKNPEQLLELGLEDYLGRKDTLILVEWAEKVKKIFLSRCHTWMTFHYTKQLGERRIDIRSKKC